MKCLILLLSGALLSAQTLSLTFDDGPDLKALGPVQASAQNEAILGALREARLHATFFVAGGRVDSPEGWALVRAWGEAGHGVANHTYSHPYLPSTPLDRYQADILRNDALLRPLPGFVALFRFPYLKEGKTSAQRDGMRAFLAAQGYRNGAVSIDASDWYFDQRYRAWRAQHPTADPAPFRRAYLGHLLDRAKYYESLAQRLGYWGMKHTLLLHHNAINAAFLPDLIRHFREHGWTFVDAQEAFRDPVFQLQPEVLPAGESLLWSLAKVRGVQGLRYPAEDAVYEKATLEALGY